MSFRPSTGREFCNRCPPGRKQIPEGESVYIGPVTGVAYCVAHATSLFGVRIGDVIDSPDLKRAAPEFVAAMARLEKLAAVKPRRERI